MLSGITNSPDTTRRESVTPGHGVANNANSATETTTTTTTTETATATPGVRTSTEESNSEDSDCTQPGNITARFNQLNKNSNMMRFFVNGKRVKEHEMLQGRTIRSVESQDKECRPSTKGGVSERSTCPWYFEEDINENRYPRVLMTAICKCDTCIGSPTNACEPVYYPVITLHKTGCVDGQYEYQEVKEWKSVACTCALPRIG